MTEQVNISALNTGTVNYPPRTATPAGANILNSQHPQPDEFVRNSDAAFQATNNIQTQKLREAEDYMKSQKSLSDVQNLQNDVGAVKFMQSPDGKIIPVFEITKDGKLMPQKNSDAAKDKISEGKRIPDNKSNSNLTDNAKVSYEAGYLTPGEGINSVKDDPENHLYIPSTVPSKISDGSSPQTDFETQRLMSKADIVEKNVMKEMKSIC